MTMKTQNPIQAKSTSDLIKVFPSEFKLRQKDSNGYKFANMLYGIEIDEARDKLKLLYDYSGLDTMDLADEGYLYEVSLSGTPNYSGYLNSNGVKIKITNQDEFHNGDPTRLNYVSLLPAPVDNKIIGLNYFRTDNRGSGYLLFSFDVNEVDAYVSGNHSVFKYFLSNECEVTTSSGFYAGISSQKYINSGADEVIYPLSKSNLSGQYPTHRKIYVDGLEHTIEHYEPYKGWVYNQSGDIVAVNDYFQEYYFDGDGNKVYHRTFLNNPYGSGNYTKQYFNLSRTPISGTLKVYDMDILDVSGNATEISKNGTNLYYLAYSGMISDETGTFDSVYKGYDSTVPIGKGFKFIEGQPANLLTTTSWDYEREGSRLIQDTASWYSPSSGEITNVISITNPESRYIVEYDWQNFKKAKYVTSFSSTKYVNLDSDQPVYSLDNLDDNVYSVPFEFTKNPDYIIDDNNLKINEQSKILTFDGLTIRPKSKVHRIDISIPVVYNGMSELKKFNIPYRFKSIGYSDDFVPQFNPIRQYAINCIFDATVTGSTVTEQDAAGNNIIEYNVSSPNKIFKIANKSWFGKKILYLSGNSYYNIDANNKNFIKNNTFFKFSFNPLKSQEITLMELFETSTESYVIIKINLEGMVSIESNGYTYISRNFLNMDNADKEIIVRYYNDDINNKVPIIELFMKDKKYHFELAELFRKETDDIDFNDTHFHLFKSCSININKFQLYYEAF